MEDRYSSVTNMDKSPGSSKSVSVVKKVLDLKNLIFFLFKYAKVEASKVPPIQ